MKHWADELPGSIRLGPFDIELAVRNGEGGDLTKNWGEFSSNRQVINIDRTIADTVRFVEVLVHEITHAIYWAYGVEEQDKQERIVLTLARPWLQIYRDNPWLLKWLTKGTRGLMQPGFPH